MKTASRRFGRQVSLAVLLGAVAIATPTSAQSPTLEIPEGFLAVDDMLIPQTAFFTDGGWIPGLWPNATVPFTFDSPLSANQRAIAAEAMASWEAVSAVHFVPRTNEVDYVTLVDNPAPGSNFSAIGKVPQGGQQFVFINNWNWGTVVHELGHTLGYVHEHMRPDRNNFVTIEWANIIPTINFQFNFFIIPNTTNVTPYDFDSIMHYGQWAFSRCPTVSLPLCPSQLRAITVNGANAAQWQNKIGVGNHLSIFDAQGMATMYGSPPAPTITALSPAQITPASGFVSLTITGTHFHSSHRDSTPEGFPDSSVLVDGAPVVTTFLNATTLLANVPGSFLNTLGAHTVQVNNASPAGGLSNTMTVNVICGTTVALPTNTPTQITSSCTTGTFTPAAGAWNGVAVASSSNWSVNAGGATSNFAAGFTDFALSNGTLGPVPASSANFTLASGTPTAAVEVVVASTFAVGTVVDTQFPAGHVMVLEQFQVTTPDWYEVMLTGDTSLFWDLYDAGTSAGFRPRGAPLWGSVGSTGVQSIFLDVGMHVIAIFKDGAVPATSLDYTIYVWPLGANLAFAAGGSSASVTTPFQPFTVTPSAAWNCVGVVSAADWDVAIGAAESQNGGATFDCVVANGNLGAVTPTNGIIARYSGLSNATASFNPGSATLALGTTSTLNYFFTPSTFRLVQFNVTTAGSYDLTVNGGAFAKWVLFRPGTGPQWRTRAQADLAGTASATPVTGISLSTGWHALVAFNEAPVTATGPSSSSILVAQTPNPAPTLTLIAPTSKLVGSATFTMTVIGTNVMNGTIVRFNGANLTTVNTFAPGMIDAQVPASFMTAAGTATITLFNPAPGGGTSNAATFTINNPAPAVTSTTPATADAGGPSFTLTVTGSGFVSGSQVRLNGMNVATTFVSTTQLAASVPASWIVTPGTIAVSVANAGPGGGVSGNSSLTVFGPTLASVTPASTPVMTPASAPITLALTGTHLTASLVVYANGTPLPTTFLNSTHVSATLSPATLQTQRPGGIALTVSNVPAVLSNSIALRIGSGATLGSNQGTMLRVPPNPSPGQQYTARWEGYPAGQPFTVFIDTSSPQPLTQWPNAASNFVLACHNSPTLAFVIDGIGLVGPPLPVAFTFSSSSTAPGGKFDLPGLTLPNPPSGLTLTSQTIYLDPAAPLGWRLSWARWPEVF